MGSVEGIEDKEAAMELDKLMRRIWAIAQS
jgi:hypothetical protein